jgi:enoyl-CoA hydratase/carnithine racemase
MSGLLVETVGPAVVLTLDRPASHNAIDGAMARALVDAVRAAESDPKVRGIVLTGAGDRTFSSGGDINMLAELAKDHDASQAVLSMGEELLVLERASVPVIAAIQGDAFGGGCELILLCDMAIVERHARLAFRHAKMGLSPAWGGLSRLVERVGPTEAARVLFTAEAVDAAEAVRIGLVNEVVAKTSSRDRALARIARIAENPRAAVARLKRTLCEVRELGRGASHEVERAAFASRWGSPEHLAALQAFAARRG